MSIPTSQQSATPILDLGVPFPIRKGETIKPLWLTIGIAIGCLIGILGGIGLAAWLEAAASHTHDESHQLGPVLIPIGVLLAIGIIVFIHETAHALVARSVGFRIQGMKIGPLLLVHCERRWIAKW